MGDTLERVTVATDSNGKATGFTPKHGGGKLVPWQKGQSGNPGGKGGRYHTTIGLVRDKSLAAVERLVENLNCGDPRVEVVCAKEILERAWGAPQAYKGDDDGRMVIDLKALNSQELRLLGALLTRGAVKPAAEDDGVVVTPVTSES